jgi:hypothetical protein
MNSKLRALVEELAQAGKRSHYECEDSWYSCPRSPSGCSNESEGEDCNCGADRHNAEIDGFASSLLAEMEAYESGIRAEIKLYHEAASTALKEVNKDAARIGVDTGVRAVAKMFRVLHEKGFKQASPLLLAEMIDDFLNES